jgi:hypothetical protein
MNRQTRKAQSGGWSDPKNTWSFGICKGVIAYLQKAPKGLNLPRKPKAPEEKVKRNWRECLEYIAKVYKTTPENLYNRVAPADVVTKIAGAPVAREFVQHYYGAALRRMLGLNDRIDILVSHKTEILGRPDVGEAKPLPGSATATRKNKKKNGE